MEPAGSPKLSSLRRLQERFRGSGNSRDSRERERRQEADADGGRGMADGDGDAAAAAAADLRQGRLSPRAHPGVARISALEPPVAASAHAQHDGQPARQVNIPADRLWPCAPVVSATGRMPGTVATAAGQSRHTRQSMEVFPYLIQRVGWYTKTNETNKQPTKRRSQRRRGRSWDAWASGSPAAAQGGWTQRSPWGRPLGAHHTPYQPAPPLELLPWLPSGAAAW